MDEPSEITGFQQASMKVLFDGGEILVFADGREVGKCSVEEFARRPSATFRRLYRYAEET